MQMKPVNTFNSKVYLVHPMNPILLFFFFFNLIFLNLQWCVIEREYTKDRYKMHPFFELINLFFFFFSFLRIEDCKECCCGVLLGCSSYQFFYFPLHPLMLQKLKQKGKERKKETKKLLVLRFSTNRIFNTIFVYYLLRSYGFKSCGRSINIKKYL